MRGVPDPPKVLTALLAPPVIDGLCEWLIAICAAGDLAASAEPVPEFITPQEAADLARCSVGHIRRLYMRGDLTRHGAGRRVLLSREEVMAHAAQIA